MNRRNRRGSWIFWVTAVFVFFTPASANASSYTVTEESDWYFEIEQDATDVVIYGNSNSSCEELTSDPYLWLYDLSGTLITGNDDGNHNGTNQCVSSKIDTTLDAGVYRLHAGYCCNQRGNGFDGGEYTLVTDLTLATNFSTYNGVRFSYDAAYIEQTIDVSSYAGEIDSIVVTPLVKRSYDVNDYVATQYAAYDSAGNLLQGNITSSAPTSWVEVPSFWFSASTSTNVQDSTSWDTVKIRIWAKDGEGWGGNYGTEIKEVAFKAKLDGSTEWTDLTNLLTNPYFNSINSNSPPDGWSSDASWDTCQGLTSSTLCGFVRNTWTWATPATTTTTTTSTTTTTVPQTIGPPMNLTGEITSDGVYLDWDAPNTGNVQPERYAISFRIPPDAGWGVATGNVGDENALNTEYTLPFSLFESTGGLGEEYVFDVRADNDTLAVYSGWSTQVTLTVEEPAPPTTTTTSTTTTTTTTTTTSTTTTTLPPTTTTEAPPSTTTPPPPTSTSSTTTSTTSTVPPTTSTSTTSTSTTTTTTSTTTSTLPPTTTTSTVPLRPTTTVSTTTEVIVAPTTTIPRTTTTTTTTNPVRQPEIVSQNQEKIAEAIAITTKIEDDELAGEVFTIIAEEEVTVEQIEKLVNDDNFDTLDDEQIGVIANALNDEADEVKEVFEAEVNIFSGASDEYVPSGSAVSVAERRIIVAATAVVMAAPMPAPKPASPSSGGTGGTAPSGGGGSSDSGTGRKRKK